MKRERKKEENIYYTKLSLVAIQSQSITPKIVLLSAIGFKPANIVLKGT